MLRPTVRLASALGLALILSACGSEDEPDVSYAADVQPILAAHCTSCHGAELQNSAPSHLHTYEDASAKANAILNRAVDGTPSPMPPSGLALSADEIETLEAWVAQGTPE